MSDAACSRGGAPPTKRLVFFIRICSGCGGARNRNQELSLVRIGEPVKNYLADFFLGILPLNEKNPLSSF